ncbi:hypothetical protein BESB_058710 [Besnoitia besnoiti]|uniref:MYND-type domain-containing protein n=1 Tax=Besnoitia besnoiti TaxID=94643 RepID=A0A2A9MCN1_BESBE|nr:hypothetical protein BESB_058710 [Besnoitia besnoiti]PFH34984.1 hypothetical protein BESB_058710 [Besnoitia besnoiti]
MIFSSEINEESPPPPPPPLALEILKGQVGARVEKMDKLNLLSLHVPPMYGEQDFPEAESLPSRYVPLSCLPVSCWSATKGSGASSQTLEEGDPTAPWSVSADTVSPPLKEVSLDDSQTSSSSPVLVSSQVFSAPSEASQPQSALLDAAFGESLHKMMVAVSTGPGDDLAANYSASSPLSSFCGMAPVVSSVAHSDAKVAEGPVDADGLLHAEAGVSADACVSGGALESSALAGFSEAAKTPLPDSALLFSATQTTGASAREVGRASASGAQTVHHMDGTVTPTTRFSTEQEEEASGAAAPAALALSSAGAASTVCASPPSVSSLLAACLPPPAGAARNPTLLSSLSPPAPPADPLLSSLLAGGDGFLAEDAVGELARRRADAALVSDPVAGRALTSLALLRGVEDSLSPVASTQRELQRLLELQHEQQRQRRFLGSVVKGEEEGDSDIANKAFLGALEVMMRREEGEAAKAVLAHKATPHVGAARNATATLARDHVAAPPAGPTAGANTRSGAGRNSAPGASNGDYPEEDLVLVASLRELLETLPRKKEGDARMLLSGEKPFVRPYARQIVETWKIHLGETGRTTLKKEISERTQADATLKRRVLCIAKLKMATLEELVQIAEITGLLERTLQIANKYEAERQAAPVSRQNMSRRGVSAVSARGGGGPVTSPAVRPAAVQNFLGVSASQRDSSSVAASPASLASPSLLFAADASLLSAACSLSAGASASCFSTGPSSRRSPSPAPAAAAGSEAASPEQAAEEGKGLTHLLHSASGSLAESAAVSGSGALRWSKEQGLLLGAAALSSANQHLKAAAAGDSSSGLPASPALFDLGESELSAADAAAAGLLSLITQQQARSQGATGEGDGVETAAPVVGPTATEGLLLAAFGGDEAAAAVVAALASGSAATPQLRQNKVDDAMAGASKRLQNRRRTRKRRGNNTVNAAGTATPDCQGAEAVSAGGEGATGLCAKQVLLGNEDGAAADSGEESALNSRAGCLTTVGDELMSGGDDDMGEASERGLNTGSLLASQLAGAESDGVGKETGDSRPFGSVNSPLLTLLEQSVGATIQASRGGVADDMEEGPDVEKMKDVEAKSDMLVSAVTDGTSSPDVFAARAKTAKMAESTSEGKDGDACVPPSKIRLVGEHRLVPLAVDGGAGPSSSEPVSAQSSSGQRSDETGVRGSQSVEGVANEGLAGLLVSDATRDSDADSRSTTSGRSVSLGSSCIGGAPVAAPPQTSQAAAADAQEDVQACSLRLSAALKEEAEHGGACGLHEAVATALRCAASSADSASAGMPSDAFAEACAKEAQSLLDRAVRANLALGLTSSPNADEDVSQGGARGFSRKRSRQDDALELHPTLQVLSTVCVMYLKEKVLSGSTEAGSSIFDAPRAFSFVVVSLASQSSLRHCWRAMDISKKRQQVLGSLWGARGPDQQALQLTPYMAEELVQRLTFVELQDICSPQWYAHHEVIEQINLYAHKQAAAATDEFVMDMIVNADKIYHEALLINLLEVLLYHKTAAQAAGDYIVDLVDYINRKVIYLLSRDASQLHSPSLSLESGAQGALPSDEEELERQQLDCRYKICMTCLSILRFITDHREGLPVTVTTRLLDQHDMLLSLVTLMERKPWYRTRRSGETEFFEDQQWILQRSDEASMPKVQAQVWLVIYNLVMDQECRNRQGKDKHLPVPRGYEMTTYRRDTLLRLRRHLNETVHDQIPPLADLHRALEQLAIAGQRPEEKRSVPPILVELVSADVREKLLHAYEGKWEELAAKQKRELSEAKPEDLNRICSLMMSMPLETLTTSKRCRACGRHADQRCAKCKAEWYCSRECQIGDWRSHKDFCSAASRTTDCRS